MTDERLDERLDELLDDARETYRRPPKAPLDAMWVAIDAEMLSPARWNVSVRRRGSWAITALAAAATLLIGVAFGRQSMTSRDSAATVAVADNVPGLVRRASYSVDPLQRSTSDYLGEAAALLDGLQSGATGTYSKDATTLLVTTRLLLDSPATSDARLRDLLQDLELFLAQIATMPNNGSSQRQRGELQLIRSALDEREMVPRLRTAVVTLAHSEE